MPWIAALALLMIATLVSCVAGAEFGFRRALRRRERLIARRRAVHS
jgi:hypothetical protein